MVRIHREPPFPVSDLAFPSSRGLGHLPFTEDTGVQIPLGTPNCENQKALIERLGLFYFHTLMSNGLNLEGWRQDQFSKLETIQARQQQGFLDDAGCVLEGAAGGPKDRGPRWPEPNHLGNAIPAPKRRVASEASKEPGKKVHCDNLHLVYSCPSIKNCEDWNASLSKYTRSTPRP